MNEVERWSRNPPKVEFLALAGEHNARLGLRLGQDGSAADRQRSEPVEQ